MERRERCVGLKGFGVPPGEARVEIAELTRAERVKRAAATFGVFCVVAAIAIPIPLVHLVLVPGALLLGAGLGAQRLTQSAVFHRVEGGCPFCGTEQTFSVMGRFRLPKTLSCVHCHRELSLEEPGS
jgi:hypothetical protein